MAEEIRLVGVFQDNITPQLKKLNTQINTITKSFEKFGKKLRPISKEMGNLAAATERVADALKQQKKAIDANSRSWNNYKKEVGQAGGAQRKAFKGVPRGGVTAPRIPKVGATGQGGGESGGGGGLGGVGAGFLAAGMTIGNQFGSMIMQGMSRAFDAYKNILLKPFKFLMSGIQERIDDEMDDIKTAGGLFSISKRSTNPFISSFAEAESLTKETNRYLAELAGALPGDTQQYIGISRQISDGIYQILSNDKEGSLKLAQKIASENGRTLNFENMSGSKAIQAAGKELVGEMTKLTVLGSLGQKQGAMGLPQLIEQMMSQDQVSSGQFKRYAAIFRDPLIKGALERNIPAINAAGKNTAERLEALRATLNEVVTPELVRRYQRSTAGVIEEMKTIFLNPEVGMLGLGKPLQQTARSFNQFGEELFTLTREIKIGGKTLEKGSNITARQLKGTTYALKDVATAANENLAIFDYIRDIFGNLAIVMGPIISAAASMFTGFEDLGEVLGSVREFTMKLQSNFEQYRVGLESLNKDFGNTTGLRAALATINNLFANLGIISDTEFLTNAGNIEDVNFKAFGEMISDMVTTFLESKAAVQLGKVIGEVIGTILASFAQIIEDISNPDKVENLFTGFMEGFEGAGGKKAMKTIMGALVDAIVKVLGFMVREFPKESFTVALIALAPAIVSGVIAALPAIMGAIGTAIATWFSGTSIAATIAGWAGGVGPAIAAAGAGAKAGLVAAGAAIKGGLVATGAAIKGGMVAAGAAAKAGLATSAATAKAGLVAAGASVKAGFLATAATAKAGLVAAGATIKGGLLAAGATAKAGFLTTIAGIKGGLLATGAAIKGGLVATGAGIKAGVLATAAGIKGGLLATGAALKGGLVATGAGIKAGLLTTAATIKGGLLATGAALKGGLLAAVASIKGGLLAAGAALKGAIMTVVAPFAILAAKVLLVAAGVIGLILIIRNFDIILSSLGHALMMTVSVIKLVSAQFVQAGADMAAGLLRMVHSLLSKVGMGGLVEGPLRIAEQASAEAGRVKIAAEQEIANRAKAINENTQKSLQRTQEDFAHLKAKMGEFGDGLKKNMGEFGEGVKTNLDKFGASTTTNVATMSTAATKLAADFAAAGAAIKNQAASPMFTSPTGGPMGAGDPRGGGGGPISSKAAQMGLTMTSHMRPGDPGWHGVGRAWDYSNSTGPTSEMHAFASDLANNYGGNLKELIYTPLGYSIKDGQKVPPYAQEGHYNHVHVAYGMGANSPAFFNSQQDAIGWEKKVAPANSAIASVTSNSSEFAGGSTIKVESINISGVNDPRAIANSVASEILYAIKRAENTELDIS